MGPYWNLIVGVLIIIVPVTLLVFWGKKTGMWLIVVAGAVVLTFANIDKIQWFKIAGIEAEMRKAVQEANATIEQLRSVATTSARATITSLMANNFIDDFTLKNQLELHDQLISNLEKIGASKQQIGEADEMWKRGVGVIYHRGIGNKLDSPTALEFQGLLKLDDWKAPSSGEIEKFIESKGLMNQELKDLIDEYKYFESTGTIRRKELFFEL